MDDRELNALLFPEDDEIVDHAGDIVENEETDVNDHDGHRLRLRRQIMRDGFDGVRQRDLLELMLCYVQSRQDVNTVCDELMSSYGDLRDLLKADLQEFSKFDSLGDEGARWLDAICALARKCRAMRHNNGVQIANFHQLHDYAMRILKQNDKPCCFQLLSDGGDHLLFQRKIADDLRWGESRSLACAADDAFSVRARNSYLLVFTDDPFAHPSEYDADSLYNYSLLLQNSICMPRDILFMNEEHCVSLNKLRLMNNLMNPTRRIRVSISEDQELPAPEGGLIVHRASDA